MNSQSKFSRRTALGALATATGSLFLRSLATGIPSSVLLDPLSAHAGTEPTAKTLILASSISGDPMNANVPGTYDFPANEVFHPADPSMAKTSLTLSGKTFSAAKPWADLGQGILDRTTFFHHATYTPVHGELPAFDFERARAASLGALRQGSEATPALAAFSKVPVTAPD